MNYNNKFAPTEKPNPPHLRVKELINLFGNHRLLTGSHIIKYMKLANESYYKDPNPSFNTDLVEEFFNYFCSEKNILKANPNFDTRSKLWIQNHYSISEDFKVNDEIQ